MDLEIIKLHLHETIAAKCPEIVEVLKIDGRGDWITASVGDKNIDVQYTDDTYTYVRVCKNNIMIYDVGYPTRLSASNIASLIFEELKCLEISEYKFPKAFLFLCVWLTATPIVGIQGAYNKTLWGVVMGTCMSLLYKDAFGGLSVAKRQAKERAKIRTQIKKAVAELPIPIFREVMDFIPSDSSFWK